MQPLHAQNLADLAALAMREGFIRAAAIPVSAPDADFSRFWNGFLASGDHADLAYLTRPERLDLRAIHADARTLLLFAYPYRFRSTETKLRSARFKIARYAWQRDYHDLLKEKLKRIATESQLAGRAVTDSAPLPERYWARRSGLGRLGRNGMLIIPGSGSFFLIAALLIENPLEVSQPQVFLTGAVSQSENTLNFSDLSSEMLATCGTCRLCIDACPTAALTGDGLMRVADCLSYRTIETKEDIAQYPAPQKHHRWVFGCDICQQVCPYNKTPASYADEALSLEHEAAETIAAGEVPRSRSALKGSVFYRRGPGKLAQNIAATARPQS